MNTSVVKETEIKFINAKIYTHQNLMKELDFISEDDQLMHVCGSVLLPETVENARIITKAKLENLQNQLENVDSVVQNKFNGNCLKKYVNSLYYGIDCYKTKEQKMVGTTRIADYFFVASVQIDSNHLEGENPNPIVLDRFPEEDYGDVPFTENAEFFCLPEGARIEHREVGRRKPYIFTFCFTQSDGSQSYGTSLVFYEKLKLNGQVCYNKYNQELYIPKALCILSLKPFFSCHTRFLKFLFKKALVDPDQEEDEMVLLQRSLSRRDSMRRMMSSKLSRSESLIDDLEPIERDIRYYIEGLPYTQPGIHLQIPLFNNELSLTLPPANCLPFCDFLCLHSLFQCLSVEHIHIILSTLLLDGKVVLHSQNKYQLTLCSTALLALLKPVHYTLTFIPLLPPQLIDYIEAPTPYLIGIFSATFSSYPQEEELQCLLVHLDFDRLTFPAGMNSVPFPLMEDPVFSQEAPLEYEILWEDPQTQSARVAVSVGPGVLGLYLKQEARQLLFASPGEPAVLEEVVYVDSQESERLSGVLSRQVGHISYLQNNPALIEVNQMNVVGMPLKRMTILLASSTRPLRIVLQAGIYSPKKPSKTPVPSIQHEIRWYYEEKRIQFFLFFVQLFKFYFQYMETADTFDSTAFVNTVPEEYKPFLSEFVNTQLFEGLIQMTEKEMMGIIRECIQLLNEEDGVAKIYAKLHPKNWNLRKVVLPPVDSVLSEDIMNKLIDRDGCVFPRLESVFLGAPIERFDV